MLRLLFLLTFFATAHLAAQKMALENGSTYEITKVNPEGSKAEVGEYLRFHASLLTQADSLMFSTKTGAGTPQLVKMDTTAARQTEVSIVLREMRAGEVARITMPMDQFGVTPPGLEEDTLLFYEVELLEIVSEEAFLSEQKAKEAQASADRERVMAREEESLAFHNDILAQYRAGTLTGIQSTASGLKYIIHEEGEGDVPAKGDPISVNYIGSLAEGDEPPFDQSFKRGVPINFSVGTGRVIEGWDEGLLLLPKGSKATFFIPAELGYGDPGTPDGTIPPGAELVFYVEVE